MPKLDWTGNKQSGFSCEYNNNSLYLRIRGDKYAGIVLNHDKEEVGGGWFVSNSGSAVEDELILRCGGNVDENETNISKSPLENLFNITPELEDDYNRIQTDSQEEDENKLRCEVCKEIVDQFDNYKKLCNNCFDKYELPVSQNICKICKEKNIDPAKIKITYMSSVDGFLVCTDCWDNIYIIKRDLPLIDCTKCNLSFKPCNHYEYLFKTCTSPKGYCSSIEKLLEK